MKLNKEQTKEFKEHDKKILDALGVENLLPILHTLLGVSDNVSRFIAREYSEVWELPAEIKYSLLHVYQILRLFSDVLNDKIKREDVKIGGHFPVGAGAWKSEGDFEKRLITLVRLFHHHLKEEGKL